MSVYEILGYHDKDSFPHLDDFIELFRQGHGCFLSRDWQRGKDIFSRALALNDSDRACRLYLERCEYFLKNPPGDDWDGVWVMETK